MLRVCKGVPLQCGRPLEVCIVVFVDGVSEGLRNEYGAVVWDQLEALSESLVTKWTSEVGQQLITQVEFLLILLWRFMMSVVKFSFVKGLSTSKVSRQLVRLFQEVENRHPTYAWFERVCSFSHLVDLPSRDEANEVASKLELRSLL
eukprot:5051019-Amphidinium_carterae.1